MSWTSVQDPDRFGSMWEDWPRDGTCHWCMIGLNGLARAEGQEGDQLPARIRSTVKEELSWLVANFMGVDEGEASSEVVLIRAWGLEQGGRVIKQGRRGPMHNVSSSCSVYVIHGGSSKRWRSREVWHLVSWWQGSEPMATPSTR